MSLEKVRRIYSQNVISLPNFNMETSMKFPCPDKNGCTYGETYHRLYSRHHIYCLSKSGKYMDIGFVNPSFVKFRDFLKSLKKNSRPGNVLSRFPSSSRLKMEHNAMVIAVSRGLFPFFDIFFDIMQEHISDMELQLCFYPMGKAIVRGEIDGYSYFEICYQSNPNILPSYTVTARESLEDEIGIIRGLFSSISVMRKNNRTRKKVTTDYFVAPGCECETYRKLKKAQLSGSKDCTVTKPSGKDTYNISFSGDTEKSGKGWARVSENGSICTSFMLPVESDSDIFCRLSEFFLDVCDSDKNS